MYEQVEKPKENKSRAVANSIVQKKSNRQRGFEFVDNRPGFSLKEKEGSSRKPVQLLKKDAIKYIKANRHIITEEQLSDKADYWDIIHYLRDHFHPELRNAWNKDQPEDGKYRIRDSDLSPPSQSDIENTLAFLKIYALALELSREIRRALLNTWSQKFGSKMKPTEQALVDKNLLGDEINLDPLVAIIGTDFNQGGNSLLLEAVRLHYDQTRKVPLHMAAYLYNQGEDWTRDLNVALIQKIIDDNMVVKVSHVKIRQYLDINDIDGLLSEVTRRSNPDSFGSWDEIAMLIINGYNWDNGQGLLVKK
ncbi:MAG: hypothetical protein CENE_00216 [Candidatus Celerinatantimonas neptuna]|nr:MAG: hypothetical protein CENE_00216 [Candidatus Celerinatantimonas neptuna]